MRVIIPVTLNDYGQALTVNRGQSRSIAVNFWQNLSGFSQLFAVNFGEFSTHFIVSSQFRVTNRSSIRDVKFIAYLVVFRHISLGSTKHV